MNEVDWQQRRISTDDGEIGVTAYTLDSGRHGPHLLVLGGVHGNEIGGIVAAGSLTTRPVPLTAGRVTVVPVAHEAAKLAFSRTGPADDGNLARAFPGDSGGSSTARLADLIAQRLLRQADVLVDLHTSSPEADMPFFAGGLDDGTAHGSAGVELAVAFGAGIVWTHPAVGPGRTLSFADQLAIPAIYVESPRGGVLDVTVVAGYLTGLRRVVAALEMSAPVPIAAEPGLWLHGEGDTDSFTAAASDGYFMGDVKMLQSVSAGQRVGRIVDHLGRTLSEIEAPCDGLVSTLRTVAPVLAGTPLIGVTAVRPDVLQLPSDEIVCRGRNKP